MEVGGQKRVFEGWKKSPEREVSGCGVTYLFLFLTVIQPDDGF